MYYSSHLKNCSYFAVNPQTNILRYGRDAYEKFARVCFDWTGGPVIEAIHPIVSDLTDPANIPTAPGLYLQNKSDWHVNAHAKPFLKALGCEQDLSDQSCGNAFVRFRDWGKGHARLPPDAFSAILNAMVADGPEAAAEKTGQLFSE